jgi:hypothetical protein
MTEPIDPDYDLDDADDRVRRVIIEKHVHTQVQEPKSSIPAFIAGFLFAALAAAIGAIVFLAVSDRDDDGNIQFDVPSVGVDVDADPDDDGN